MESQERFKWFSLCTGRIAKRHLSFVLVREHTLACQIQHGSSFASTLWCPLTFLPAASNSAFHTPLPAFPFVYIFKLHLSFKHESNVYTSPNTTKSRIKNSSPQCMLHRFYLFFSLQTPRVQPIQMYASRASCMGRMPPTTPSSSIVFSPSSLFLGPSCGDENSGGARPPSHG